MWHKTRQDMKWKVYEGGTNTIVSDNTLTKTGGTGCKNWVTIFCTDKMQSNNHLVSAPVLGCSAHAKLETTHVAMWGIEAPLEIPYVGTLATRDWGETSRSTQQDSFDDERCTECDNPSTPEIEPCGGSTGSSETGGGGSGGGGGPCPECITEPVDEGPTTCYYRYWYRLDTGEEIMRVWLYCL
jgi:hypothetical protein